MCLVKREQIMFYLQIMKAALPNVTWRLYKHTPSILSPRSLLYTINHVYDIYNRKPRVSNVVHDDTICIIDIYRYIYVNIVLMISQAQTLYPGTYPG